MLSEQEEFIADLRARLSHVEAERDEARSKVALASDLAERGARKGYDLDPYDVLAALGIWTEEPTA